MFEEFLPYIDVTEGMSRVLNNKKLFAKLLKLYPQNIDMETLGALIENGKMNEAQVAVHTLKGVSANLSINGIYEASKALEAAIKESSNPLPLFESLKQNVEITLSLIEKLIAALS